MNPYRGLPSVDRVLAQPELEESGIDPALLVELVREAIDRARDAIARGEPAPGADAVASRALASYAELGRSSLQPVINATGVIIHTNLGRVPLSDAARAAMEEVTRGYSNLEYTLEEGARGSRHTHVEVLLRRVTGAEAGLAVNNNAAAVLLVLSALCARREVVISRGELVEIGGGFRIPDVLRQSGARLVEVGTTNRTYVRDYEASLTNETAAYLRVHSSNFRVIGFVEKPELRTLATSAHAHGALILDDLGSGALLDTTPYGIAPEPLVQDSLADGADLVMFSGDKLLGGPQAGIIAGRADLVERVRRHPLARAVRLDKASLAALNATLLHYVRGEAIQEIPVWRMIATSVDNIEQRARAWAEAAGPRAMILDSRSMIGGGSLPEESLPTRVLAISASAPERLARALRRHDPPIVARVEHGRLVLDPRTVPATADGLVARALQAHAKAE
jgi:L-seryl-tRNA(Ser) seleniumtransferase